MYKMTDDDVEYCTWLIKMFYRYHRKEADEDDVQAILENLVPGSKDFNPNWGIKYVSFVKPWIKKLVHWRVTINRKMISRKNGLPLAEAGKTDISYHQPKSKIAVDDLRLNKRDFTEVYEDTDLLEKTMVLFPDKIREALLRHYLNGETYNDIAAELGYASGRSLSAHAHQWRAKVAENPAVKEMVA